MQLLITGGSSYLGQRLLATAVPSHSVHYTYFQHPLPDYPHGHRLDLRQDTAVFQLVQQVQPDVIIHTAGSNRGDDMGTVIRLGARHLSAAAQAVGARLIHLSTDSIFDGLMPPYDETAVPTPVNEYGRAKADAEAIVQRYANHVIVRTSLIYSLRRMDHGTAWMAQALQAGEPVTLFNNQIRNPVWIDTLSAACLELAAQPYRGVLNVGGQQTLSRAAFALKMLDWWRITARDTLTIAPSPPGRWPLNCELDLSRATAVLQTPLPGVDQVIAQQTVSS